MYKLYSANKRSGLILFMDISLTMPLGRTILWVCSKRDPGNHTTFSENLKFKKFSQFFLTTLQPSKLAC